MIETSYEFRGFKALSIDIYNTAREICNEIISFQPDLIVGVAHSGWMPVQASKKLWSITQKTDFPNAFRINIGHEKLGYLFKKRQIDDQEPNLSFREINELKKKVFTCTDWIIEFRYLVEQNYNLSVEPNRIMIIDDFISTGKTAVMATSVAKAAFPKASVIFLSGRLNGWRQAFTKEWILETGSGLLPFMLLESNYSLWNNLKLLVSGTEDIEPYSLDSKSIKSGSQVLVPLLEYISENELLELPRWADVKLEKVIGLQIITNKVGLHKQKKDVLIRFSL